MAQLVSARSVRSCVSRADSQSQTLSALQDAQAVRASVLALGLDMVTTGVSIPWTLAQRFQQHVASACALPWTPPIDSLTTMVLPALRDVLDSPQRLTISTSKKTILVGSLFVPVIVDFSRELEKHDFLTQRCLLDIFMVFFFKHDTRPVELAARAALQALAEFAANDASVENRLLAIQILQIAVSRMERESLSRAVP